MGTICRKFKIVLLSISYQELETLRTENARLKDENSSLLRVISQISAMKPVK